MNRPDEQNLQAILEDPRLTRAEKIRRLRDWIQDALEVDVANEEGMRGKLRTSNLDALQKALREFEASSGDAAAQS
jgi:hypothetical protein